MRRSKALLKLCVTFTISFLMLIVLALLPYSLVAAQSPTPNPPAAYGFDFPLGKVDPIVKTPKVPFLKCILSFL